MMDLMFLVFVFFFNPMYFFGAFVLFSFYFLNDISWLGTFVFCDSGNYVVLVFMSLFILGIVLVSEKNFILILLSEILVFFCVLFFFPGSMIFLYMYFELSMFPILVMILGYGSQIEKINSAYYLIFYAAFCSFPFLFVYFNVEYFFGLVYFDFVMSWELIFILSLSFMMKFPVYFLHLWLPKAHVEAPTTASMLLAGLLLKLGTAGFMRILGSLSTVYTGVWLVLSFLGMILASFCCVFQSDSKSLAAYSSVSHMSFLLMIIIYVFSSLKTSSLLLMLGHGYTSTLMFYLIGEFYHVSGSRLIYYMGGFLGSSMVLSILISLVFLSNSGVPPSLSFLVEFVGISSILMASFFSLIIIMVYFFVSFYYSLFFLTNSLMGKVFLDFSVWGVGFSIPLVLMMFNVFWLGVIF